MSDKPNILSVNVRYYPNQEDIESPVRVVTVLVAGAIGDYAAYSGNGSPEWVARFGDKISFQEAARQFSPLEESKYRS